MKVTFTGLKKIILLSTFGFLTSPFCKAQLITDGTLTPTQLVQNVLLGSGVTVSNVTFTGITGPDTSAIGKFSGTTNIGLASGIVMTTGTIYAPNGPAGPNNSTSAGIDNGQPGDALLDSISGGTDNAAVLEFDFVPSADTVKFRYVFGSDEYPEFVCSTFNDIFGFFISGPKPSGGSYIKQNIALIPGTTLPVSINTVNPGVAGAFGTGSCSSLAYSADYVDNTSGTTIQYDGFTKVFTAIAPVICGSKYHIKLAIADVGDGVYDSGVFLEGGSFSSSSVSISSKITFSGSDTVLFEGCGQANIILSRGGKNLGGQDTMLLSIGGTATNGVDYTKIKDSLIFPIGVDTIIIPINAFSDGISEGIESLTIAVTPSKNNPCLKSVKDSIVIYIKDRVISLAPIPDVKLCPGDSTILFVSASGGASPYNYSWSTGATNRSIKVGPTVTKKYYVTVGDTCGTTPVTDSVNVKIPVFTTLALTTNPDTAITCPAIKAFTVKAQASGGIPGYSYSWSAGLGSNPTITVNPQKTTSYTVTVIDSCGKATATHIFTATIVPTTFTLSTKNDTSVVCSGDPATVWVQASGTATAYTYSWNTGSTATSISVNPTVSKTYVVTVTDNCGPKVEIDSIMVRVPVYTALSVSAPIPEKICPGKEVNLFASAEYGAGGYTYTWTTLKGTDHVSSPNTSATTVFPSADDGFMIKVTDRCGSVAFAKDTIPVDIEPSCAIKIPNVISPNGDNLNDYFIIENLDKFPNSKLTIYDRWGLKIFESENYLNNWNAPNSPDGTYYYILSVSDGRKAIPGFLTVIKK